jgi:hypothetical protein
VEAFDAATGHYFVPLENGAFVNGWNVITLLVFHNGIYGETLTPAGVWWKYNYSANSWTQLSADPRTGTGRLHCTADFVSQAETLMAYMPMTAGRLAVSTLADDSSDKGNIKADIAGFVGAFGDCTNVTIPPPAKSCAWPSNNGFYLQILDIISFLTLTPPYDTYGNMGPVGRYAASWEPFYVDDILTYLNGQSAALAPCK